MRIDRIKLITELAKRDMTQAKLAELSGVSRATINYVKSGKSCTDNNMNQYAKKANATGSIYPEDINSMKAKYDELIQVYGNVLQQFNEIAEAIY